MPNREVAAEPPWREPWRTGGIVAVARRPRVLWLFARGEMRNRYRGTWLGGLWDYMRPLTRFFVYFVVIGVLLQISKSVDNFGVYIFSGILTVQLFGSALVSGTRSLAKHSGLLRRVNVPRENIPIATVLASFLRQKPALIILMIATVLTGWRPNHLVSLPFAVAGVLLLGLFVSGLSLVTSVANMYVRDTQYAVETLVMLTRWASPVLYPWTLVSQQFGDGWVTTLYLSNPVTVAMIGIRQAFWAPTVSTENVAEAMPPVPTLPVVISVLLSLSTFAFGLWLVRRTEHRVASRISWNS